MFRLFLQISTDLRDHQLTATVAMEAMAVDIQEDMGAATEATLVVAMEDTQEVDMEVASVLVKPVLLHNLPALTKAADSVVAHTEVSVDQDLAVALVDLLPMLKLHLAPLEEDLDMVDKH